MNACTPKLKKYSTTYDCFKKEIFMCEPKTICTGLISWKIKHTDKRNPNLNRHNVFMN